MEYRPEDMEYRPEEKFLALLAAAAAFIVADHDWLAWWAPYAAAFLTGVNVFPAAAFILDRPPQDQRRASPGDRRRPVGPRTHTQPVTEPAAPHSEGPVHE